MSVEATSPDSVDAPETATDGNGGEF